MVHPIYRQATEVPQSLGYLPRATRHERAVHAPL